MKGILFKPDMIEAIIEGKKTQTRRVIKPQPTGMESLILLDKGINGFAYLDSPSGRKRIMLKPRYQVGETVYIKEGIHRFNIEYASYDLDFTPVMFLLSANRFHWRWERDKLSPMFLPHEAARHFITITDVRAERVKEICYTDCANEGFGNHSALILAKGEFIKTWDSINKLPYDWQSNPWVWVYEFRINEIEG